MESPVAYFETLNAEALNKKAADYLKSDILNNPDLALIDADDEDFKEVVRLVAVNYPKALPDYVEPASSEPTLAELKDSLEGAKLSVDFLEGSEKQDMQDYIDGLEVLIESMSFENGGYIPKRKKITKSLLKAKLYKPTGDFFIEDKKDIFLVHFTPKDADINFQNIKDLNAEPSGKGLYGAAYLINKNQ